ncbi:hypothetical protein J27TS7_35260 [Paenibacillus dendritiformis]|nr:hypothetical protein J27TS7_35260 [Paenibacillus dendritiformis]
MYLDKNNVEDIITVTPTQEGILFHYVYDRDESQYFEQLSLSLSGKVETESFERAWNNVVAANGALRSLFRWTGLRKPVQIILKKHTVQIQYYDLSGASPAERADKLREAKEADIRRGFHLEQEVPFRVMLCKLGENRCEMVISSHHILYDGWSTGIIIKEFIHNYEHLSQGKPVDKRVKNTTFPYLKKLNNENMDEHAAYWKKLLAEMNHSPLLPTEPTAVSTVPLIGYYGYTISPEHARLVEEQARKYNMTAANLCYAAWGLLLRVYTNRNDVVFGTTVSGRNDNLDGIMDMVGLFIRTLPVRIDLNPAQNTLEMLRQTHLMMRESERHSAYPLVRIIQNSEVTHHALFDTLLVIQNYPLIACENNQPQSLAITSYSMREHTNYPISVGIQTFSGLTISVSYNERLFCKAFIEALINDFEFFLVALAEHMSASIGYILERYNQVMLEKALAASRFAEADNGRLYHEWFEEQVRREPELPVLVYEGQEWTYEALNRRANQLAGRLLDMGVEPGCVVSICQTRSIDLIASVLAVMKAGGVFVPVDPDYPKERIHDLFNDSQSRFIMSDQHTHPLAIDWIQHQQVLNVFDIPLPAGSVANVPTSSTGTDLSYILYTSGTSGKPKGVMIENRNLVHFIESFARAIAFSRNKSILGLSTFSFDIFVVEILLPLVLGMRIVLANSLQQKDPLQLCELVNRHQVNILQTTPTRMKTLLNHPANISNLQSVTDFLLGGEPLSDRLIYTLQQEFEANVYNLYGPTETTVWSAVNRQFGQNPVRIGRPIDHVDIYILDRDDRLKPLGAPGEVCISGRGVGRGYWNNPELTAKQFVPNPFRRGSLMYRTGDLARWTMDGELEFLGRMDRQVKIRGYRIELAEVESQLLAADSVTGAAVVAREDAHGHPYLCAYVVGNGKLPASRLREHMALRLPEYMVPGYFIQLDHLPVNHNGKLNTKLLPAPRLDEEDNGSTFRPVTELDYALLHLWTATLSLESAVPADAHFMDLGGHSLQAMYLVTAIEKELGITVTIQDIFQHPSIAALARFLSAAERSGLSRITPAPAKGDYPLSSAQQGMYLSSQWERDQVSYNLPFYMKIAGQVDKKRVERTFELLIERHESLRTSFHTAGGEVVQRVHSDASFSLEYEEIKCDDLPHALRRFVTPFHLEQAPLLRIKLLRLAKESYVLAGDLHHMITDGQSVRNLLQDFVAIYQQKPLEAMHLQYKDYAVWENQLRGSEAWNKAEEYWLSAMKDAPGSLRLPSDFPHQRSQERTGSVIQEEISSVLAIELKEMASRKRTTLFSLMLASYYILLHKYSGQEDIIVGVPFSGRWHPDLQPLTGMFVNTMPIRHFPRAFRTFDDLLFEVKSTLLFGLQYQYYPFAELVRKTGGGSRNPSQPLFNTVFTMLTEEERVLLQGNTAVELQSIDRQQAKFDLTFTVIEKEQVPVKLVLEYAADLFLPITADRWIERYVKILEQVARQPDIRISDISLSEEPAPEPVQPDYVDFQF